MIVYLKKSVFLPQKDTLFTLKGHTFSHLTSRFSTIASNFATACSRKTTGYSLLLFYRCCSDKLKSNCITTTKTIIHIVTKPILFPHKSVTKPTLFPLKSVTKLVLFPHKNVIYFVISKKMCKL